MLMEPLLNFLGNFMQRDFSALQDQFFIHKDQGDFIVGTYLRSSMVVIQGVVNIHVRNIYFSRITVFQLFLGIMGDLVPIIYRVMAPVFSQNQNRNPLQDNHLQV